MVLGGRGAEFLRWPSLSNEYFCALSKNEGINLGMEMVRQRG